VVTRRLIWLQRCESTNDEAVKRLDDPTVWAVGADHQTAGRGRLGRAWWSAPGGLYLSWIARPRFHQSLGAALPLLAAVAVADALRVRGLEPQLKWPNDVRLQGRKLAGVLCEARGTPTRWCAVVGLGLNLRRPAEGWPVDVPAVALDEVNGNPPEARALAACLLPRFDALLARIPGEGLGPIIAAWERHGPTPGTRLRRGDLEGRYLGLAADGALRLETASGLQLVHTGDVELVSQED
jgi:BirA family biotin operon repressor/biotin-[acetyl-CoA-carboxylase] ligase